MTSIVQHIERARVCPDAYWHSVLGMERQILGGYSRARIYVVSPDFAVVGAVPDRNVQGVVARVDVQVVHFDANVYIGNWRRGWCGRVSRVYLTEADVCTPPSRMRRARPRLRKHP